MLGPEGRDDSKTVICSTMREPVLVIMSGGLRAPAPGTRPQCPPSAGELLSPIERSGFSKSRENLS